MKPIAFNYDDYLLALKENEELKKENAELRRLLNEKRSEKD